MSFRFSARSRRNLQGVHIDLVRVAERALAITTVDFSITEGVRPIERQREMVRVDASRTLNGRHVTGHAIDLVAWVGGTIRWEMPYFVTIAGAFRKAGVELHIPLRWGGVWDRLLTEIEYDLLDAHREFVARFMRRYSRPPLVDGPHIELSWKHYPATEPLTT